MATHKIFFKGAKEPIVVQPATSTWRPSRGEIGWKVVDADTHTIVETYTPTRKVKQKPITPFKGSWADQEQKRGK